MLAAFARRAEATDLAERGGAVAEAHGRTPNSHAHSKPVSSTEPTMVRIAKRLLVVSSNAAPVSIARWRTPDNRCWKKLQVSPMSTTRPIGFEAALVNSA